MIKVPYLCFPEQFEAAREATVGAVLRVFEKGDFILGAEVERFEEDFAKLCGVKHAIGVANGTDALILALKVIGLQPGDEVITASNSWVSSASAVALLGGKPVFADVQPDQNISPEAIEVAITPRTRAILPVHLAGRCADMRKIMDIAQRHRLPVIEDAAQSVSSTVDGKTAGSFGLMGCFSLHPLKNLNAAGDAGVITTQDDEVAAKLRLLRHHGLKNREEVVCWGYNSRLDTLQAAVLRTRMALLPEIIEKRRAIAKKYLAELSKVVFCPPERANERHTYHVFAIQCDRRDELKEFLAGRGIDTKIHYPIPIHLQKAAEYLGRRKGSLPATEHQAGRILSLPVHQFLTDRQVDWVCESIRGFYGASR